MAQKDDLYIQAEDGTMYYMESRLWKTPENKMDPRTETYAWVAQMVQQGATVAVKPDRDGERHVVVNLKELLQPKPG